MSKRHPLATIYRGYTAAKAAVISLFMILLGVGIGFIAWFALQLGISYADWNAGFTTCSPSPPTASTRFLRRCPA